MSWQTVLLAEVADIERKGVDPSIIEPGTNYLGLEHIESGGNIIGCQKVQNGELASTKFQFGPHHVLYGKLRPYLAKIALPDFDGICSTDILPVKPGPKLDRRFLAYFLRQQKMVDYASSRSTGANLPRLSPKALGAFKIPLPSLEEQKRIAAILDQADELRRLRCRALDKLHVLRQSVFYEMFGDFNSNPKGWPIQDLGSYLLNVTNGMTRRHKGETAGQDIVLRLKDIRTGWIDFSEPSRITLEPKEKDKFLVQQGDLLFVRVNGNPDYVGRCAVFNDHPESVFFNDHIMRVRIDGNHVIPRFLSFVLNEPYGKREIALHRKTSAGQHTINQDGLSRIKLPLPPLKIQKEFCDRLRLIDASEASFDDELEKLECLFASLQHRAFKGEL